MCYGDHGLKFAGDFSPERKEGSTWVARLHRINLVDMGTEGVLVYGGKHENQRRGEGRRCRRLLMSAKGFSKGSGAA